MLGVRNREMMKRNSPIKSVPSRIFIVLIAVTLLAQLGGSLPYQYSEKYMAMDEERGEDFGDEGGSVFSVIWKNVDKLLNKNQRLFSRGNMTYTSSTEDPYDEFCRSACENGYGGGSCDCADYPIG